MKFGRSIWEAKRLQSPRGCSSCNHQASPASKADVSRSSVPSVTRGPFSSAPTKKSGPESEQVALCFGKTYQSHVIQKKKQPPTPEGLTFADAWIATSELPAAKNR